MPLAGLMEYVKAGGGICAPLLLLALFWLNGERKDAVAEAKAANEKMANLSERTIVLFTEIKGLLGNRQ